MRNAKSMYLLLVEATKVAEQIFIFNIKRDINSIQSIKALIHYL